MKKLYAFLILSVLIISGSNLLAQDSPFSFGVKAGVNFSTSSIKTGDFAEKDAKVGFNLGVIGEYQLIESFYLQSGLSFTTKGTIIKGADMWFGAGPNSYTYWKQPINQMYLQVPVLAAYKVTVIQDLKLFIHAGPYFAYGIGGKANIENTYTGGAGGKEEEKKDTFDKDGLKKFDIGLLGGIGTEFGQFVVTLDYELGLTDLSRRNDSKLNSLSWGSGYKNRNASLSFGYKF